MKNDELFVLLNRHITLYIRHVTNGDRLFSGLLPKVHEIYLSSKCILMWNKSLLQPLSIVILASLAKMLLRQPDPLQPRILQKGCHWQGPKGSFYSKAHRRRNTSALVEFKLTGPGPRGSEIKGLGLRGPGVQPPLRTKMNSRSSFRILSHFTLEYIYFFSFLASATLCQQLKGLFKYCTDSYGSIYENTCFDLLPLHFAQLEISILHYQKFAFMLCCVYFHQFLTLQWMGNFII